MADPLNASPNNITSYSFDPAGRLTGRTEANGIVTTAIYTGMDLLASKTEVAGSTTLASWTGITYDQDQKPDGVLIRQDAPDAVLQFPTRRIAVEVKLKATADSLRQALSSARAVEAS